MTEVNISPGSVSQKADIEAARHPRVEQFKETFRMLLRNKGGLVGMIIVALFYIIAIMDAVYPAYLGVPHDVTLSNFIPKSAAGPGGGPIHSSRHILPVFHMDGDISLEEEPGISHCLPRCWRQ